MYVIVIETSSAEIDFRAMLMGRNLAEYWRPQKKVFAECHYRSQLFKISCRRFAYLLCSERFYRKKIEYSWALQAMREIGKVMY